MTTPSQFVLHAGKAFLSEQQRLIQLDPTTSELKADAATLRNVQTWFNGVHVWVSLLTGTPLAPIVFRLDGGAADNTTLLHVAAVTQQAVGILQKQSSLLQLP